MQYCQVVISATSREEANKISDYLTENKLVAGTMITSGPSRYWWQGDIVEREYFNLSAFSLMEKKDDIISAVKELHADETPIIFFVKIDGNEEFLNWVAESIR